MTSRMANHNHFLITGAHGQLAAEFQNILALKNIKYDAPTEKELDITNFEQLRGRIEKFKPKIILNCAAYNFVDEAEENAERAYSVNAKAVEHLAALCQEYGVFLVHYSTDYVFDGCKQDFYDEEDIPKPLNTYGQSKLEGERIVRKNLKNFLLLRLSWVFGPGKQNFLKKVYEWSKKSDFLNICQEEKSVPTYTFDVATTTLLALEKKLSGLYHLTNSGACSRDQFAIYFLARAGIKKEIKGVPASFFRLKAKRPAFSAMSNSKISKALGIQLPTWQDAVDRYVKRFKNEIN